VPAAPKPRAIRTKLSYKEQRELDALLPKIAALEQEIADLEQRIGAPDFYTNPWETTAPVLGELRGRQVGHESCTERWRELEELRHTLAPDP
jgi:ATP-binding cassette subfamily F protein uup